MQISKQHIIPLGTQVLIEIIENQVTDSGIVMVNQKEQEAIVIRVGKQVTYDIKEGDSVMFKSSAVMTNLTDKLILIGEGQIACILKRIDKEVS